MLKLYAPTEQIFLLFHGTCSLRMHHARDDSSDNTERNLLMTVMNMTTIIIIILLIIIIIHKQEIRAHLGSADSSDWTRRSDYCR